MNKALLVGVNDNFQPYLRVLINSNFLTIVGVIPSDHACTEVQRLCLEQSIPFISHTKKLNGDSIELAFLCSNELSQAPQRSITKLSIRHFIDFAGTQLICGMLSDMAQRIINEQEEKELYLSALNNTTQGVQIVNESGIIQYINPAFSKITGVHASERIGKSTYAVSNEGAGAKVLRSGRSVKSLKVQVCGTNTTVISNGSPLIIRGQMRGAVVLFQDVTDIMRLQNELELTKMAIKTIKQETEATNFVRYSFDDMIGSDPKTIEAISIAKHTAENDSTVLITGESGTGKEILAHAIHQASNRWKKPFVAVNCAALSSSLVESELFGHEKGAFTGAHQMKRGKFELATDGTIFLDEIGEFSLELQAKLLRVLQERCFERIGGNKQISSTAKVIAATNQNLNEMVRQGRFRSDLYYRLQVICISLPPLRKRKADIPLIAEHLIRRICRNYKKNIPEIRHDVLQILQEYSWPGNIRELENILTRAVIMCHTNCLTPELFSAIKPSILPETIVNPENVCRLEDAEALLIIRALDKYGTSTVGKQSAAKALNISLATLYNKLKKLKI